MAPGASASVPSVPFRPEGLLYDLLAVSLSAVNVLSPVYGPAGEITDFAIEYLNPAGQRMTGLAERPGGTLLTRFPYAQEAGILDYYRRVYAEGATDLHRVNYQADGLDNYFHLAARRSGDLLVVSFSDTADQPRTPVEVALREAQTAEKAARAEVEEQRNELRTFVEQAPVAVVIYRGPEYRVEVANAAALAIWGRSLAEVQNRPVFEVLPEAAAPDVVAIFDRVFTIGTPHTAHEQPTIIDRYGRQELVYWNFVFQPERLPDGRINGIVSIGTEVTEQLLARRQVEQLNQELEARVQQRTHEGLELQAELLTAARQQADQRAVFYQIFEETPAAICIQRGPEHCYEYANAAYLAFFPGREFLGRPVAEVLPETVDSGVVALLDHVYQTGETYYGSELPLLIAQPEGPPKQMYFTFTYQAYREHGQIVGISTFAYNVAEQVLARQERESERQRLFSLFQEAPAGICILAGPELVYEFMNPGYQQLMPQRALLGRSVFEALPELVGTPVEEILRQVYATGQTHEEQALRVPIARSDNGVLEDRYFTFVYQARRDEHGQVTSVLTFVFEVTEQVQARQAAEASTRQLRLVTDALPVLIGYLDRERRYQFANEAYRSWFNQDPAALLGRKVREVVGEEAYAYTAGYMDRALAGELLDFEATMPYREGFTKHIRTSYVPDAREGQVQGFYTLVTDITEQAEARQEVESLNQKLATINEALTTSNQELYESNTRLTRTNVDLDNFIYTASHDLKAPIANIEGLLSALQSVLPAAGRVGEVPTMLDLMQKSVERFGRTIGHLTDISRLQKEHAQPATTLPLARLVQDVQLDLAPLIAQTHAQVETQVPAAVTLTFSEKNLRSVVYNLLSNALKYHHPDRAPRVRLVYQAREGWHVLEVRDNGLGLDLAQDQGKLFGMFQRLHAHIEGTGVGLHMVKRMVENAGGRIEVESQLHRGSTFRVLIPQ